MKKIQRIVTCLLAFLIIFPTGCKGEKAEYDLDASAPEFADIRRGWAEHGRGRYEHAITDFNLALKENPQSAEAYLGLAMSWEDKGDYDKAIEYFSKGIELESRAKYRAGYFYFRALLWLKKNNCERTIEDCTSAINTDPTFVAAYVNRAYCYRKIGKLEEAVADYDKVLDLTPDDKKAHNARKEALMEIGKLSKDTLPASKEERERREKFRIESIGLSKDVSNLWLGSHVGAVRNRFSLSDAKVVWFCKFKSGLRSFAASFKEPHFEASWFGPDGKLFKQEEFTTTFGNADLARNELKIDASLPEQFLGKWRVEVRLKDEVLDEREFEMVRS